MPSLFNSLATTQKDYDILSQQQIIWLIDFTDELQGVLTYWGQNKMAAILQTTLLNTFSWMKMF